MARASLATPEDCSLYVGDLDPMTNEAHLFGVFGAYGPVHSIRVVKDSLTHRSLGYAFVNYLNRDDGKWHVHVEISCLHIF
jgi:polyadenylate-binding protein